MLEFFKSVAFFLGHPVESYKFAGLPLDCSSGRMLQCFNETISYLESLPSHRAMIQVSLNCCTHGAIVFCTDLGGWGESTINLLLNIHPFLCKLTTYECFVCFSIKFKSPSLR